MRRFLILVLPAFILATAVRAQQPSSTPKVVKSDAKEMTRQGGGTPVVAPAQDSVTWEFSGTFDIGPAHPECSTMTAGERDACTAARVLTAIRSQGNIDPAAVSLLVEITFGINEYGEVKDIRIQGIADASVMQKAIVALYALPRFAYATKAGARTASRCVYHVPAALLTGPEKK